MNVTQNEIQKSETMVTNQRTMNAQSSLYVKQQRLAQHYLDRLRTANRTYQLGGENMARGLKLIQLDWSQIQQWHTWAVACSQQDDEAAVLCSAYSYEAGELLDFMLTPQEQQDWREIALTNAQLLQHQQEELNHLLALGEICYKLDEYSQSEAYISRALKFAYQTNDQRSIGRGLITLGHIARYTGKFAEAQIYFDKSLNIYRILDDQTGIATSLFGLGRAMHYLGDLKLACIYAEESLRCFRCIGDRRGIAYALLGLGSSSLAEDYTEIPIAYLEEGLQLFRQIGDRRGTADILCWLSQAFDRHGDYKTAQSLGEECIEIYRDLNSPGGITAILGNLAYMWFRQGNFDIAQSYYEQSLKIGQHIDNFWLTGRNFHYLALIAITQTDYITALAYAEESLKFEKKRGDKIALFDAYLLVTYTYVGLNDITHARLNLLQSLTCLQSVEDVHLILKWIFLAAFLLLRINQAEKSCCLYRLMEAQPHSISQIQFVNDGLVILRREIEATLGVTAFKTALEQGEILDVNAAFVQTVANLNG